MRFFLSYWCVLLIGWSFRLRPYFCDSREDFSDACPEFSCGEVKNVSYPFWSGDNSENCGRRGLKLNCHADDHQYFTMEMNYLDYRVIRINTTTHTMKIARSDLWDSRCTRNFVNTTLDLSLLNYSPNLRNLTVFYNCTNQSFKSNETLSRNRFNCTYNSIETVNFFFSDESMMENLKSELDSCVNKIIVPAFPESENGAEDIDSAFHGGFAVTYDILGMASTCDACRKSGGLCRSNDSFPFLCLCPGQAPQPFNKCPPPANCSNCERSCGSLNIKNVRKKIIIGVCSGLGGVLLMCFVFLIWAYRKNNKYVFSSVVPRSFSSYFSSQSTVEKECICAGVHLFSYSELEEATNKFDSVNELGDGGFGTVYYGTLRDGRTVAVKRLHENNFKRVEQFRNEVEILSRLRHENLVCLYGCTSRQCHELLLVYEYIPNGTVADHLHGDRAKPGELRWSTRMKIAIETASALVYLHASDIIHRDIKTSNILLDHNFHVKVADFGLSRPFPTNVSHISTAPQGTPGYLDPEYNECYQLTDKSDVYSFGVVLMELISSKPAVDITRHKQEINLSTMAINKILNCALNELVDPHLDFESNYRIRAMISSLAELAFQCLQSVKDARPSMADVLQALHRIENEDCSKEKSVDIDNNVNEELLKNERLNFAQDTGDVHWFSASATPSNSR